MSACTRHDEVVQAVRAGWWPLGCPEELREHLAGCVRCAETAQVTSTFAAAREGAMRAAAPQAAGLLWWKAQLRRRNEAMERLQRPGLVISTWTIASSIILLLAVLVTAWKRIDWLQLRAALAKVWPNPWVAASVLAVLCGFTVAAVMLGLGLAEERE